MTITEEGPSSALIKFDANLGSAEVLSSEKQKMIPPNVNVLPYRYTFSVSGSGELFWAWTRDYQINVLDRTGKFVLKIKKDYSPVKTDERFIRDLIGRLFGSRGVPPGIQLTWPETFPPIVDLVEDDEGRLFVRTYERNDQNEVLFGVFDQEGKLVSRFAHPDNETLEVVRNNKAYFITEEENEGLPLVKRYGLLWTE